MRGVRKYFHSTIGREIVFLQASELFVSKDYVLATLLGSCVSVVLWDPVNQIVGMNHFVNAKLIKGSSSHFNEYRYGDASTEKLISLMKEKGAKISSLKAKVFGGANMLNRSLINDNDLIKANIDIAMTVLDEYNIPIVANDLGGDSARWVFAFPKTGKVIMWRGQNEDITKGREYTQF